MPRTIHCKQCHAVLNLPVSIAAGKKLRCPRCGVKFMVSQKEASSESTAPGIADAAASASAFEIDKRKRDLADLPMSLADGDLRDTFNLPLMSGRDLESSQVASSDRETGDAAALFTDQPSLRRKKTAADARRVARRCSFCGGLVPQGMSICSACGTDQESGLRVGLDDDLAPPPPPPAPGPPIHVLLVGGLCTAGGVTLAILSVVRSAHTHSQLENASWLCLALVAVFGVFAAIEFIRGKTARLLLLAVALGSVIDVMALIALPIIQANFDAPEHVIVPANSTDLDDEDVKIRPLEERLDSQRLTLGVVLLLGCAGIVLYVMSPPVKKYVHARVALRTYD